VATTIANGIFTFPAIGRYFKAQVTAYTSGTVACVAHLRNQPAPPVLSTPVIGINQVVGVVVPTTGVAGSLAVGGSNPVGAINPSSYPFGIASTDFQGYLRRLLLETSGAIAGSPTGTQTPLNVAQQPSNNAQDGVADALNQIVRELRFTNFILRQLPFYLSNGVSMTDEDSDFRDDPTLNSH
jgi:hypothetical protein